MKLIPRRSTAMAFLGCLLVGLAVPLTASATELKIQAQLAWGTDDSKPPGKELKELDPKLREKFRHLRWKNYFVVETKTASLAGKPPQRLKLSEKCSVEVREAADANLEIRILGVKTDGQPAVIKTEYCPIAKLKAGHIVAFAGDTKEKWDDAWLVIVTAAN